MGKLILAAAVLLTSLQAGTATVAHSAGGLGRPSYGGAGCPAGTASATLTGNTLNVRYSAYRVAAGGRTGKSFDRKACSLSMPVAVPRGKSVAIVSATYHGSARLPASARAQFRAEYFFAGRTGPVAARTLSGPASGPFSLSTPGKSLVWSACGEDVILRTNSSLRVTTSGKEAASVGIRSQDVKNAVVYRLRWRDC